MVLDRFDWASTFPQIETVGTGTDLVMILLMLPVMILYWRVGNRVGESVSGRKN